jgi:uncharacterized repeat protein (TIGR01451 family)
MGQATWQVSVGKPVIYPVRVVNTGKTPAKNIVMRIFIDIVDAALEPPLDHVDKHSSYPHGLITAGSMLQNEDFNQVVTRPTKGGAPNLATAAEVFAMQEGRAYQAVYGIIDYDDEFGHHWTRFCRWMGLRGTFRAQACTQYNSVDF